MTNDEAIKWLESAKSEVEWEYPLELYVALDHAIDAIKKVELLKPEFHDGCQGCAFADVEEWEMPCAKCTWNCKDYWRAKHDE